MRSELIKTLLVATCATLLAGCSTMVQIREDARDAHSQARHEARDLLDARASRHAPSPVGPIISDLPYVDTRSVARAPRYPATFSQHITVNEPMGVPIKVLAQRVLAMTGVRMLYQSELVVGQVSAALPAPTGRTGADATLANLPPLSGAISAVQSMAMPRTGIPIAYTGDVLGLFNAIAAATASNWEYDETGQVVQFYRYKTETFRIPAVQGIAKTSAQMGGRSQGSAGGAGGGGAITMASATGSHETESVVWDEVDETIKKLLSPEGVYAISPSTGSVTVRDRPDRIETVRQYLQETAAALSRQVDVEVTIYRVVMNDSDTRAVNWKGLFRNMLGQYSIGLSSLAGREDPIVGGLSSIILDIPLTDASGAQQRWGGSQLILDALSTLGQASVVTTTSVLTANNQPAPVKIVKRTTYLAEVAQNVTGTGDDIRSTGPTLTPGMVETGLNMYVLPHVLDDGKRVLLKMMVSLSSLEAMKTFGNDQAMIQLPQVASREFQQMAWLSSGETLVLAGFEQVDSGMDTRSPLSKVFWWLGGSSSASKGREMVVIAIHPTVTAVRSRI